MLIYLILNGVYFRRSEVTIQITYNWRMACNYQGCTLFFYLQNTVNLVLHEGALLHLEDDAPRLQALHVVPRVLGDVHPDMALLVREDNTLRHLAQVVVDVHAHTPAQQDECLVLRHMMMHRHLSTGFEGVEEPMALVLQATVEIEVHT